MNQLVSKEFIDQIKDKLVHKQQTLAIAESVTCGLLQAMCGSATDASTFFQGGITAYNIGQKILHLGVEPIHAEQCDCVSGKVASEMALGVCTLFKSDWGIGITGYATPVPASGNELFAWCAVACKGEILVLEKLSPAEQEFFPVQRAYALEALQLLKDALRRMEK